jgi:sec-independent protein translocase protein TatA
MAGIGFGELVVILLIVLVIFGAGKLPQIGDALGKSIRNFKKAAAATDEIDVTPRRDELPAGSAQTAVTTASTEQAPKA